MIRPSDSKRTPTKIVNIFVRGNFPSFRLGWGRRRYTYYARGLVMARRVYEYEPLNIHESRSGKRVRFCYSLSTLVAYGDFVRLGTDEDARLND